ncbi:hypothetical protein [uncultured Dokdonia sp.]|uniref:hypothetical protein n=1 Tax=uncultured Dokdonia sp. TaxID=575653 RepID=UPI002609E525|nr:hypothetical protein [uncultured Dokdonia sp.]
MDTIKEQEIKTVIEHLIKAGTTYDIVQLELVYHDDLEVFMFAENRKIQTFSKKDFKQLFITKRANNEPPLNNWALFNDIQVKEDKAHVLITRKVKLLDTNQKIRLSIDLIFEDNRWQVIREVIFS